MQMYYVSKYLRRNKMKRTDLSARVNLAKSAYDVNKRYNLAFDLGVNVGGFSKA